MVSLPSPPSLLSSLVRDEKTQSHWYQSNIIGHQISKFDGPVQTFELALTNEVSGNFHYHYHSLSRKAGFEPQVRANRQRGKRRRCEATD